jgi:hypothetical protein
MFRKTTEGNFKPAEGGWTFIAPYPRLVFRPSVYIITDAQKAELVERLVRAQWGWLGFLVLVGPAFAWVQMVVSRWLSSGPLSDGPGGWSLPFAIGAVLGTLIVFPFFILIHWAIKPVLSTATRIGPATRSQAVRQAIEANSVKTLIALLVLMSVSLALNVYMFLAGPGPKVPLLILIAVVALVGAGLLATLLKKLKALQELR